MYAKRMNKTYEINTPQEKQAYLARGFDLYDEDDDLIESSPQKMVAYAEFQKLRAASEAMRKELYTVRAENEQLKARLAAGQTAAPPEGVLEVFAVPPDEEIIVQSVPAPNTFDEEIKTLRPQEDVAPKMGKKK